MKDTVVAARYAKGFFLFTEKRGETARALEDLKGLLVVLKPGGRAERFLASPVVLPAEKILRQKLDDPAQRRLAGEFIDEVGAL